VAFASPSRTAIWWPTFSDVGVRLACRVRTPGGVDFHRRPLVQQRASSHGVAKEQHSAARNGFVPVIPLHRHQPCASAPTFIGPARYARSRQPVGCLAASCAAGQGSARPPAPSVLVVPPDFDGLLRASPCGLVASRSRPWGSSRFQTPAADREWFMGISHATRGASTGDPFPGTLDPSKLFPCTQPSYGQRVLRLHLSLTPASPTVLLLLARLDLSSSTGFLQFTKARILAVHGRASPLAVAALPLLHRLHHDSFEPLLPQALFRALSRAGFDGGLA
jgi:hypothetical protein